VHSLGGKYIGKFPDICKLSLVFSLVPIVLVYLVIMTGNPGREEGSWQNLGNKASPRTPYALEEILD
jgi:hypothetical protein